MTAISRTCGVYLDKICQAYEGCDKAEVAVGAISSAVDLVVRFVLMMAGTLNPHRALLVHSHAIKGVSYMQVQLVYQSILFVYLLFYVKFIPLCGKYNIL